MSYENRYTSDDEDMRLVEPSSFGDKGDDEQVEDGEGEDSNETPESVDEGEQSDPNTS